MKGMIKMLALLPAAVIFVGLMSVLINVSDQQMATSNSLNEQQIIEMSLKNRSSDDINDKNNFTSIFDGKTLDGWKMAGDGRFVVAGSDESLQSEGGVGLLWYSERIFNNFMLRLEWKVSNEGDNSGVFIRFPDPDDNPNIAVTEGYEVQLDDKAGDPIHQTGAIYDFAAPSKIVSRPPGEWNKMEIRAQGQSYTVTINGQRVTEFTGSRMTEGYIGLQAHDDESKVSFRNIMIKEIK
jgi:Domain of Unknown Function (DUF1080)